MEFGVDFDKVCVFKYDCVFVSYLFYLHVKYVTVFYYNLMSVYLTGSIWIINFYVDAFKKNTVKWINPEIWVIEHR